jgi:hypothetical protein
MTLRPLLRFAAGLVLAGCSSGLMAAPATTPMSTPPPQGTGSVTPQQTERAAEALNRRAEAEEPRDAKRRRIAEKATIESDPEHPGHADGADARSDGRPDGNTSGK